MTVSVEPLAVPVVLDPASVPLTGTHLIEASAGTGKTRAITSLYVRLLLERPLSVDRILVVTFTNAAIAELAERLRGRLRGVLTALENEEPLDPDLASCAARWHDGVPGPALRLRAALRGFDEAAVFTIHGFCQRVLGECAFESGTAFDVEVVRDQRELIANLVEDFWVSELHAAPLAFVEYLDAEEINAETIEALAKRVVANRHMPVLPPLDSLACEDLTAFIGAVDDTRGVAAQLWRQHRDAICILLEEGDDLDQRKYKKTKIREWAEALDSELERGRPGLVRRFEKFEQFTPAKLTAATKKGRTTPTHAFFDASANLVRAEACLDGVLQRQALWLQRRFVDYARQELGRRKDRQHLRSFDDLLAALADALRAPGGAELAATIRSRYPVALIDEFQDTDPIQYEIFQGVYGNVPAMTESGDAAPALFLIGDPKQSIYAFRGADVFAYLEAKRDADDTRVLDTNWRSTAPLVEAVNVLFDPRRVPNPFRFTGIEYHAIHAAEPARRSLGGTAANLAPMELLFVRRTGSPEQETPSSDEGEARGIKKEWKGALSRAVAGSIVRFLQSGATLVEGSGASRPLQPRDIAVLCRTNDEGAMMQDALRSLGVPTVLESEVSVFTSPEAESVERLVRALAEPGDARAVRAALATPIIGLRAEELAALESDEAVWAEWVGKFQDWHRVCRHGNFAAAFRRLLEGEQVWQRVLGQPGGERQLTNLLHLMELLHAAATEQRLGPAGLLQWLADRRRDPNGDGADAAQLRLESDDAAIRISTVHKSKGLQYPVVYCPFLWDGQQLRDEDRRFLRFHDPDDGDVLKLDLGSPAKAGHLERAVEEALAEQRRLLYVALTRAECRCSVVWGPFTVAAESALGALLHGCGAAASPPETPSERIGRFVRQRDDARMRADLEVLAAGAPANIAVTDLPLDPPALYERPQPSSDRLQARVGTRPVPRAWRLSSFTGLVAGAAIETPRAAADEASGTPIPVAVEPAGPPIVLHAFPTGTAAGTFIHELLKDLDFVSADSKTLAPTIAAALPAAGFTADHAATVAEALADVLATPLDASRGLRLRAVPRSSRLNEIEFVFPVLHPDTDRAYGSVTGDEPVVDARDLAAVFAHHGGPFPADYPARIGKLGFAPFAGFLRGFIDLVFEHERRWYVVDYKSNYLGPTAGAYHPDGLPAVMADHHYFLQYHLYVVAVHRYLAQRLAGYDYDRDFGGVYYLFLRGMSPAYEPGTGIFRDRPTRALIEALSAVLDVGRSAP